MKRIIAVLLTLALAAGLAACGTENVVESLPTEPAVNAQAEKEAAEKAEKEALATEVAGLIDAIGSVSVDSEDAIAAARLAYDALPADTQSLVTNADALTAAEDALITAKAAALEEKIQAIGEVTLDKGALVDEAWNTYTESAADVQRQVKSFAALQEAKNLLSALRAAEVDTLIQAVGKVSLKKEEAILTAEKAYSSLSAEEAALVTGAQTLLDARIKLTELKKEAAFDKLKTKTDKTQDVTWYMSVEEPKLVTTRSYVLPYFGIQGDNAWLRIRYHYTSGDWVFVEKITVTADDKVFERGFDYFDVQRANQGGKVWEWADTALSDADMEMIKAMADSQMTVIRFSGDDYQDEVIMAETDKQAIKDVLAAFEYF